MADQSRQNDAFESKRVDGRGHRPQGGVRQLARQAGVPEATYRRRLEGHAANLAKDHHDSPTKILPTKLRSVASEARLTIEQAVKVKYLCHGLSPADWLAAIERFGRFNRSDAAQRQRVQRAEQRANRETKEAWLAEARLAYAAGYRSFVNEAGEKFER